MTTSTITRKLGLAFAAGALVVSAFAPVSAFASEDGYDYYGGDYNYDTTDYYGGNYDYGSTDYYGGNYDYGTTDYYGGDYNYDTTDYYGGDYNYDQAVTDTGSSYGTSGSGYSTPSFGGGSSFSMPSFGSSNYNYRTSYDYPVYVPPTTHTTPSNTTVNTCTNNSCNSSYVDNSIVDNSVKISNSFNNQKAQKQQYSYDNCSDYGYGYNQGYGYNGYANGYGQNGYNYGSYNYNGNCYTYAAPIAYNTTPYITLSQAPYTGLDLGPVGEVLYWTFLVLWCLGAAYLVVVKRVQNKLVAFLNGFLFGNSTKASAHTTHAAAHAAPVQAMLVEEGTDPFIASQIKRA